MGTCTVNGKTYTGNNVSVINGEVYVDGVLQEGDDSVTEIKIVLQGGTFEDLTVEGNNTYVEIGGDVLGNVKASGSVTCLDVGGNLKAGGSVECAKVSGDVKATRVDCQDVSGGVAARGSVQCADILGDVKAGGSVICGNIGGNAKASGSVVGGRS